MSQLIPVNQAPSGHGPASASAIRHAGPAELAAALTHGREQLLALFEGFERALGPQGLRIAPDPVVNLPLWELGHIGWFEEFWIARNSARARGPACDPTGARGSPLLPNADELFDSSNVPHDRRWHLALPDPDATRSYLGAVRHGTLELLRESGAGDDELYFFRLALFHEDMHREAWHFIAQRLGIDLGPAMTGKSAQAVSAAGAWHIPGRTWRMGAGDAGFAFDNELRALDVQLGPFTIDRAPVTWRQYIPFVEAGGYETQGAWTAAGWTWRQRADARGPSYLRRTVDGWQQLRFGRWMAAELSAPAQNLSAHEAAAWCRWAGRRLPTEAEWECAAMLASQEQEAFDWGEVWEWTASAFAPYPGFVPHPYRDYSQPWFDGRPVLRGGSFATTPHMKHPRYRNFFAADRNDVFAGFRSCAGG